MNPLTRRQQTELLEVAKEALRRHFRGLTLLEDFYRRWSVRRQGSAFVTLKNNSRLRGCCGNIQGDTPLVMAVARSAVAAATRDRRFTPVSLDELLYLEITISVLGPFHQIGDPDGIEIGRHGLYVSHNGLSGLLLPQVAPEMQVDAEGFLELVCKKALLAPDAWKKGALIQVFTAEVFSSADL